MLSARARNGQYQVLLQDWTTRNQSIQSSATRGRLNGVSSTASRLCQRASCRVSRPSATRGVQFTSAQASGPSEPKPRRYFRAKSSAGPSKPVKTGEGLDCRQPPSTSNTDEAHSLKAEAPQITRERVLHWLQQRGEQHTISSINILENCSRIEDTLTGFWACVEHVAQSSTADTILAVPYLGAPLSSALIAHIRECADMGDVLGSEIFLSVYDSREQAPCLCFRLRKGSTMASILNDGATGESDPFWSDDDDDFLDPRFAALLRASREEDAAEMPEGNAVQTETSSVAPEYGHGEMTRSSSRSNAPPDDCILTETRRWVQHLIVDAAVCPFMMSSERGGLPAGNVRYAISHAMSPEQIYLDFWREVALLRKATAKEIATTLLVLPAALGGIDGFDAMSGPLVSALETLQLESFIQLVFFHPEYAFRDGRDRISVQGAQGGHAANFVRRSPYPMINILRTEQVQRGQRGIPTELVYRRNESLMREIGTERLAQMLRQRSWEAMQELIGENRPYADLEEAVRRLREYFVPTTESTD